MIQVGGKAMGWIKLSPGPCLGNIWNPGLAIPDIELEGCFRVDIEAFDIEGCFDIEYTTLDIEVFASISKLTKNLRYRRNFDIEGIEDLRYRRSYLELQYGSYRPSNVRPRRGRGIDCRDNDWALI
jgi:hypothetical protein